MLLRGDDELDPGTRFSFFFGIPDGRRLVEGTGEVVRRTNPTREGTAGLGVRFVRIAGEGEEQLESFVFTIRSTFLVLASFIHVFIDPAYAPCRE